MKKSKMKHYPIIVCILLPLFLIKVSCGQHNISNISSDSLDIQQVVKKVIETHPSVLKAQEAITTAEAGIGLAKAAYYPNIDLGAAFSRIGPVPTITIPNLGHFEMAPANNYNTSVEIHQVVYDFSKTQKSIDVAKSSKLIAGKNIDLVKQRLALLTITNYYSLAYLQEAIHIKEIQLGILNQHLDFVTRKQETGSATDYEILSTKVRISAAKNQKLDLETALHNQVAILNSLLGQPENTPIKVLNRLSERTVNIQYDSLLSYAMQNRNELIFAGLRQKQAELRLESLKTENNPVISAFATGGIKNGYFPDMNQPKANYAAGLGFKVPIYTATRHRNQLMLASSEINSIKQDIEQTRRDISLEVFQNASSLEASIRKIEQSELQLNQSEEARRLADLSYKAGTLTNLDLLDSESLEAESRLNLMKARIEYVINSSKLDISIGKQGY
jgi:outer membrane protein